MKKTYQNPTTNVVRMELVSMIASTVEGFNGELDKEGTGGENAVSRRRDLWDDED